MSAPPGPSCCAPSSRRGAGSASTSRGSPRPARAPSRSRRSCARVDDGTDPAAALPRCPARYEALWRAIVEASDNLAYLLAYNSLLAAGAAAQEASQQVFESEARDLDAQAALVAAIADGDGDRAALLADDLLSRSLTAALAALA